MKKISPYFVLPLLLFFSSCLEIVEKVTVNENKSGKISYTLKTNESGSLLNLLSGLFDASIEDQVITETNKLIGQLQGQPGISNIHFSTQSKNGLFALSFEFDNTKYLNRALYKMSGSKKTIFTPGYMKISRHKFKKINFSPWLKMYFEKENTELPDPYIISMISFSSVIEFPGKIKKIQPKTLKAGPENKSVSKTYYLLNILEEKTNTGIRVKY
ncbi:MAG: hypothetical protein K8S16_05370 [Bacteroidales bacterium]|nr:hypothetical protein [Bacteroidales bacterium]